LFENHAVAFNNTSAVTSCGNTSVDELSI